MSVPFPSSPLSAGSVEGLVVGVPQEYHCPGLHPQILQQWRQLADILSDAGAEVSNGSAFGLNDSGISIFVFVGKPAGVHLTGNLNIVSYWNNMLCMYSYRIC